MGSVEGIIPVLPNQKNHSAGSHLFENFHQNILPWTILFFLLCLKSISHLFRLSEVVRHMKGQLALKTINLLPSDRKGSRILRVCVGLLYKPAHIHTLKHLLCSVFWKFLQEKKKVMDLCSYLTVCDTYLIGGFGHSAKWRHLLC